MKACNEYYFLSDSVMFKNIPVLVAKKSKKAKQE